MASSGKWFLRLSFCCLFLLAAGALIEGPEEKAEPVQPAAFMEMAFMAPTTPAETASGCQEQPEGQKGAVPRDHSCAALYGAAFLAADANGNPVTEISYCRSAYNAFHMEDSSG